MTRGRRLGSQLLLLPVLYVLSLPDPGGFANLVAVVLITTPLVNATVAVILVWSSRQAPDIEVLRERADDAVTLTLMSLGAAGAGTVTILRSLGVELAGRPVIALLAWVLVLISVPALGWMGTWRDYWLPVVRERFRRAEEPSPPS